MSILDIFKRKKWEKLGKGINSTILYNELWAFNPSGVYLRDRAYRSIPLKDFTYLVDNYRLPDLKYKNQIFDCDDFCYTFIADIRRAWAELSNGEEALTFGYIDGNNLEGECHAWIWYRDDNGAYTWWEPQRNKLMVGKPQSFRTFEG